MVLQGPGHSGHSPPTQTRLHFVTNYIPGLLITRIKAVYNRDRNKLDSVRD